MSLHKQLSVEQVTAKIYDSELSMGQAAAKHAAILISQLLRQQEEITIMFAAAVSQKTLLDTLEQDESIDWTRINAIHMDEYHGLRQDDPSSLSFFLMSRHLSKIPIKRYLFMDGGNPDMEAERLRYEEILRQYPCDIAFLGIGDNGHLAFNEPHVANFNDLCLVKLVDIDAVSKQQQVNAGNFPSVETVPSTAFTVTIPQILKSKHLLCVVTSKEKAQAVHDSLYGPISHECPASILRTVPNTILYLEPSSAQLL